MVLSAFFTCWIVNRSEVPFGNAMKINGGWCFIRELFLHKDDHRVVLFWGKIQMKEKEILFHLVGAYRAKRNTLQMSSYTIEEKKISSNLEIVLFTT